MASSTCAISTFGVDSPWLWMCVVILFIHSFCSSTFSGCNCSAKNVRTSLENSDNKYIASIRPKMKWKTNMLKCSYDRVWNPFNLNTAAISLLKTGIDFIFVFLCCVRLFAASVDPVSANVNCICVNQLCFGGYLERSFKKLFRLKLATGFNMFDGSWKFWNIDVLYYFLA